MTVLPVPPRSNERDERSAGTMPELLEQEPGPRVVASVTDRKRIAVQEMVCIHECHYRDSLACNTLVKRCLEGYATRPMD